jgi:hypothetical protein
MEKKYNEVTEYITSDLKNWSDDTDRGEPSNARIITVGDEPGWYSLTDYKRELSFCLSLYEISFVVLLSSYMYWLCMAEGLATFTGILTKPKLILPFHILLAVITSNCAPDII